MSWKDIQDIWEGAPPSSSRDQLSLWLFLISVPRAHRPLVTFPWIRLVFPSVRRSVPVWQGLQRTGLAGKAHATSWDEMGALAKCTWTHPMLRPHEAQCACVSQASADAPAQGRFNSSACILDRPFTKAQGFQARMAETPA